MIAAGTKIFSRKLKTNDAMNQNVREELPPQFAFEHEPYHAPGIILEEVNDPHEEFIKVTYWMPYQKLLLIPRTGAIAPTCERNALVHRSNMMFLEPEGEFSETAWNQKVSWANLCWHIRGERLQNLMSAAAPTLGAPATSSAALTLAAPSSSAGAPTSADISCRCCRCCLTMNENDLSSRDRFLRGRFKCNLEVLCDKYNMDYKKEWEQIVRDFNNMFVSNPISLQILQAKFMEWQESLWFEAELEAEHAAEQQAATKKAKVEVEPEQVVPKAECALGTTCSSSTSSTFASAMLKAEVESSEEQVQEHQEDYPHLDECASAFPMTKVFIEWQESICFEAELEAEHAAEQQAAAKKAKVEVKPEHVVPKAENTLGTTCSGSTSSFPMKVGDVVLFRDHGREEWEEGVIKGIEGGGADAGEELYTVSTSSEGYIGQILTKRTFEATGLRRRNLAFEGQKEPHELSPGEEVDAKCPFIVNCDERGFLPATIVRKVHNHAMNDDIYVVKWRLQDLMQLPIYSHLYLRLVEGVSFPDDSPYVEDDTIKRYDIMCLRKGEPDLSASSMWSTSNGIIEPDEMPIDSWLGKLERSQMIDMRKKRRGLLGFEAGDKVFMLDPNVREKTEEFAAGFIYRVISDEHITEYMEAIAEYGKSNKLPYLGKYYVVYPHPTFKTTDWSAFRLDLCCVARVSR